MRATRASFFRFAGLLRVLVAVLLNFPEEMVRCGIRNKNCGCRWGVRRGLPQRNKFDVLLTILQPLGGFFRSRWYFEIEIDARSSGENIWIALRTLSRCRGHRFSESESHCFGVSRPIPLGEWTAAWPQVRRIRLRLPASCQIEVREVARQFRHLVGCCLSFVKRCDECFRGDARRSPQDGLFGGLFAGTN